VILPFLAEKTLLEAGAPSSVPCSARKEGSELIRVFHPKAELGLSDHRRVLNSALDTRTTETFYEICAPAFGS
jgi:hypothetical protein